MSIARQLYQLQKVDLELESSEQTLRQLTSQLGEDETVTKTQGKLAQEQKRLEEFSREQRSLEWEIENLTSKLATAEEQLYSGRIRNPKELTNLQREINQMKAKRNQHEDKVLETMEQVERAKKNAAVLNDKFKVVEAEWQSQQQQLLANLEQLKTTVSKLKQKQKLLTDEINPQIIEVYQELKRLRRTAVAKVEQGVCQGCRISLPVTELQRIRSNDLVRCSSCGRVLFMG